MRKRTHAALAALALAVLHPVPSGAHAELDEQIAAISEEIARQPGDAELYFRRGELYRERQEWVSALDNYAEAARLAPSLYRVELATGRLQLEAGRLISAGRTLDHYTAAHPEDPDGWLTRAELFLRQEERARAFDDFARGVALLREPRPEHFINWSRTAATDAQTLSVIEQGIRRLGPVISLQVAALELEQKTGDHKAALARVDQILSRSTRKEQWLLRRGEILDALGRKTEAAQSFTEGLNALELLSPFHRGTSATRTLKHRLEAALERTKNP